MDSICEGTRSSTSTEVNVRVLYYAVRADVKQTLVQCRGLVDSNTYELTHRRKPRATYHSGQELYLNGYVMPERPQDGKPAASQADWRLL